MNNSRFLRLWYDNANPATEVLDRAYPGYRLDCIDRELRSMINTWCYGPVWSGRPMTLDSWRRQSIAPENFRWLREHTKLLLPRWNQTLERAIDSNPAGIPLAKAFALVTRGIIDVTAARIGSSRRYTPRSGQTIPQWRREIHFPRKAVIEAMIEQVSSRAAEAGHCALLHGSVADGGVVDGFSDCDLTLILNLSPDATDDDMLETYQWVLELNKLMLAYNPAAHHGPMLMFRQELSAASPVRLPPTLLDHGLWIGERVPIAYRDDRFSAIAAFAGFEYFFERTICRACDIRSVFDAIWWTASTNLLPCLLSQVVDDCSLWKGELFRSPPSFLPEEFHPLLSRLSDLRTRIGQFAAPRLQDPIWPLERSSLLPGACLATYKNLLAISDADCESLGITDELLESGRRLWEYASARALQAHADQLHSAGAACSRLIAWPHRTTEVPVPLTPTDYAAVREKFLVCAARLPDVLAVYEFGTIGCPGLSDLDFLVVLSRTCKGTPQQLTLQGMDARSARVMGHDPIFIGEDFVDTFGQLFPIFDCKQILGEPLPVRETSALSQETQAALYTTMNALKYPADILWLSREKEVRWTTLLAYLNSFNHVARCLKSIGMEPPAAVQKCIDMNAAIRSEFGRTGNATLADLAAALPLMIRASTETMICFRDYWHSKIPQFNEVLPSFSAEEYLEENIRALESPEWMLPTEIPAIRIIGALSTLLADDSFPRSELYKNAAALTNPLACLRKKFADAESAAGRVASGYIRHPRYFAEVQLGDSDVSLGSVQQLHNPHFEHFMFALNSFAAEHKLRLMTNWSKVWEYPWLWFKALSGIKFQDKHVIDLGSELSPMPWFLAQHGAHVHLVETSEDYVPTWQQLRSDLKVNASFYRTETERLPFQDNSIDVLTSFSVIEHQPDKRKAIDEAVRVLKPGGLFAISFDICEESMGMTFPQWNGRAITTQEFEEVIWRHPAFGNTARPSWNLDDIQPFLQWHRRSAPHHNYVVAAAVLRKKE